MTTKQCTDTFMEAALDRWGDAVFRTALAQTHDASAAQDISQEVFLRLLTSDKPFEDDEHLKAWLLRVTVNCCRDLQKAAWSKRVELLSGDSATAEPPSPEPTPEDRAIEALDENPIWHALRMLPQDQQLAMHLRYVEECDDREIARIMGVAAATVRTRLHRARKQLRALLEEGARQTATEPSRDAHRSAPKQPPARAPDEGKAAHLPKHMAPKLAQPPITD